MMKPQFKMFLQQLLFLSTSVSLATAQVFCPADIAPCQCNNQGDGTIAINCGATEISQERASAVLDLFLQPGLSPVSAIDLQYNGFTTIPLQVARFTQLRSLNLQQQAIRTIPSGAFPASLTFLEIHLNLINSIQPGALQGIYKEIHLQRNSLTWLNGTVFQSAATKMVPLDGSERTGFIEVDQNPFDCDVDVCHLAWIVRDNRHLFSAFSVMPVCSNGIPIDQLDPRDARFRTCAYSCPLNINGPFPNPYSCNSYIVCIDGRAYSETCSFPLVYNPETKLCDLPDNVPGC